MAMGGHDTSLQVDLAQCDHLELHCWEDATSQVAEAAGTQGFSEVLRPFSLLIA